MASTTTAPSARTTQAAKVPKGRMSFARSMSLKGLAAAVLAPTAMAMVVVLPFIGLIAFAIGYQVLLWVNGVALPPELLFVDRWIPDLSFLPALSWRQSFFLGGALSYAVGYLRGGHLLVTPWLTMLFVGAVHHEVFPQVPPIGLVLAVTLYVPFVLVRLVNRDWTKS